MNCQEFWDCLPPAGREISDEQSAHLGDCPECAAQWAPQRRLAAGLRALGEDWRNAEAPARVEAGLMAAYRSHGIGHASIAIGRRWWTPVLVWASAAAATVALAVMLVRVRQPVPVTPRTVASPVRVAPPSTDVAAASDSGPDDDASVLGEGFVHLPNAPVIQPNEDYNVVRVEVPGAAMIDAGIALGEDRAAETVVADVALGADGTPRAVRLVGDAGTH